MDASSLALSASVGAALLALAAVAALGGRKAVRLVRDLGVGGLALALFFGVALDSLSTSLVETKPYTLLFLSTNDLRAQALMEDADLRTRMNVDPRLRFIPTTGREGVPNLESSYRIDAGPLRTLDFAPVRHATPVPTPHGVARLGEGDPTALRAEVGGLYESARARLERADHPESASSDRAGFARTASVGLLALGCVGLSSGLLPLVLRLFGLLWDVLRLMRATGHSSYRGARGRAVRAGTRALRSHRFADARPFASLATLGTLAILGGLVLGFLREEEVRRTAHAVFVAARHLRIDRDGP